MLYTMCAKTCFPQHFNCEKLSECQEINEGCIEKEEIKKEKQKVENKKKTFSYKRRYRVNLTTYTNTQALKPWLGLGLLYKNIDCVVVDVDVSKKKKFFFGFFFGFFWFSQQKLKISRKTANFHLRFVLKNL